MHQSRLVLSCMLAGLVLVVSMDRLSKALCALLLQADCLCCVAVPALTPPLV
jgi:hypothetical protein